MNQYFVNLPTTKVAILTNGQYWTFYAPKDEYSRDLNLEPYYTFDLSNYQARYERNIPTTNTKYFSGNCILYCIYLFRKTLRYFQQVKPFHIDNQNGFL